MRGLVQKPMLGDECMSDGTNPADRKNVLKMLLNEGSGNKAFDLSGNGNTGTFGAGAASPIWVAGKFGSALSLDGGDYINCGSGPSLDITDSITLVIWIKRGRTGTREWFFAKTDALANATSSFTLEFPADDTLNFILYSDTVGKSVIAADTSFNNTSDLYQIAGTYDGSIQRLYVNGIADSATLSWSGSINVVAPNCAIGRAGDYDAGLYALCQIELAMLYNRILSASEIALLYRKPFCDLGPRRFLPYAPAAAVNIPVYMHHYRQAF